VICKSATAVSKFDFFTIHSAVIIGYFILVYPR